VIVKAIKKEKQTKLEKTGTVKKDRWHNGEEQLGRQKVNRHGRNDKIPSD